MKRMGLLRAIAALIIACLLAVAVISVVSGEEKEKTEVAITEGVIGQPDGGEQLDLADGLVADWEATATQIVVSVQNDGKKAARDVRGSVYVEEAYAGSFAIDDIPARGSGTATVECAMEQCSEDIVVTFDGGSLSGSRVLPEELAEKWQRGTFPTVYDSVDYHYATHGEEVGAESIVDYAEKAQAYREEVLTDVAGLSSGKLKKKYAVTVSKGKTAAHKYKQREDERFIILSDEGDYILSFGR